MRKLTAWIMAGMLALSLAGCSNSSTKNSTTAASTAESTEAESTQAEGTTTSSENEAEPESDSKALVVYFSATGNTKAVAETLADLQGADLFEIVPEELYTQEDLNYSDRMTRASAEQNDPNARPAIAQVLENLDDYDTVYVGYPIWWGDMPKILYTFFDAYDFSGKTIAPFCTSGSSTISNTVDTMKELEPDATVLSGIRVGSDIKGELTSWLEEIGLN